MLANGYARPKSRFAAMLKPSHLDSVVPISRRTSEATVALDAKVLEEQA
jgi:hypothetical protein